jgi:hypothetical protein
MANRLRFVVLASSLFFVCRLTAAHAADPGFCKQYAQAALTQVRGGLSDPACGGGLQGARWSTDFAGSWLRAPRILVQTAAIAILEMVDAQTRIEDFTDFDCRDRRRHSAKCAGFRCAGFDRLLIAKVRVSLLRDNTSVRRSAFSRVISMNWFWLILISAFTSLPIWMWAYRRHLDVLTGPWIQNESPRRD